MNSEPESASQAKRQIGKQVVLPWSKAIEIAAKSIKVRFWRSMITMSSIILAIAFLMSIWTSTAITAALAVGPRRDIGVVKQKTAVVRGAINGEAGAPSPAELKSLFAADLLAAQRWNAELIAEKQDAKEDATYEEKKKLDEEIAELKARAEPAKHVEFLHTYLKSRRQRLERVKGQLDAILQQERVGSSEQDEPEAPADAPSAKPAQAAAGGFVTDFLRQMSPTDTWLAILALLVCLVGIANAMFMTVQERVREIGTMKCLGALDGFIVKLFLLESSALGFLGTLLGIILGMLLSSTRQLTVYGTPVLRYYPNDNIALAAAMAAIVGLLLSIGAAIFPAQKAARMQPVEAMRAEE